jgi:hypothetical protein
MKRADLKTFQEGTAFINVTPDGRQGQVSKFGFMGRQLGGLRRVFPFIKFGLDAGPKFAGGFAG